MLNFEQCWTTIGCTITRSSRSTSVGASTSTKEMALEKFPTYTSHRSVTGEIFENDAHPCMSYDLSARSP